MKSCRPSDSLLPVPHPGLDTGAYLRRLRGDPCAYCGFRGEGYIELDHIVPRSRGGANSWTNFTAACGGCNVMKLNYSLLTWLLRQDRLRHNDLHGALAIEIGR
jgi:HNH endonuclease